MLGQHTLVGRREISLIFFSSLRQYPRSTYMVALQIFSSYTDKYTELGANTNEGSKCSQALHTRKHWRNVFSSVAAVQFIWGQRRHLRKAYFLQEEVVLHLFLRQKRNSQFGRAVPVTSTGFVFGEYASSSFRNGKRQFLFHFKIRMALLRKMHHFAYIIFG